MKLRESSCAGIDVLHLEGEIDLHEAPALRGRFAAKAAQRCPALIVDMAGVPLIDSTGISVLLEYLRDIADYGGSVCIAAPTCHVRIIFEMIRLETVIGIFDTITSAAEALHEPVARVEPGALFRAAGAPAVESPKASQVAA